MKFGLFVAGCGVLAVRAAEPSVDVHIHLVERNMDKLEERFWAVSDPTNPLYGQYLSAAEMTSLIGVGDDAFGETKAWLAAKGATHIQLGEGRTWVKAKLPLAAADALESVSTKHDGPSSVRFVARLPEAELQPTERKERSPLALDRRTVLANLAKKRAGGQAPKEGDTDPASQKQVYGVPLSLIGNNMTNLQMVWGTGTYGVQPKDLDYFWDLWEVAGMNATLMTYEGTMGSRGDNYKEGCLDSEYITGAGNGVQTIVANSDTSADAEEGLGYGKALLAYSTNLVARKTIPHVLSLSIGSLSFASCDLMCKAVASRFPYDDCWTFLTTTQRQVCMFGSQAQTDGINANFMKLGARGMSIFASSGDGGSHWAFGPFNSDGGIGDALNVVGCDYNWPVFPADSPYVTTVGGTDTLDNQKAWVASGGGFSWDSPRPAFQSATVDAYIAKAKSNAIWPAAKAFNSANRGYPDVAAYAGEVPYVENDSPGGLMGTSVSAPTFAGMVSLLNDRRLSKGLPVLGFINPRIYQVATAHPGEAFHSLSGGSSCCDAGGDCCATGYPVTDGWNPVTGLGWPLWAGLTKYMVVSP